MQRSQGTTQSEQSAPCRPVIVLITCPCGRGGLLTPNFGAGEEGRRFTHCFCQQLFYFCLSVPHNPFTVIATGCCRRRKYIWVQVGEWKIKPSYSRACVILPPASSTSRLHEHTSLPTYAWTQGEGALGAPGSCLLLGDHLPGPALPGSSGFLPSIAFSVCSHFARQQPWSVLTSSREYVAWLFGREPLSPSWLLWLSAIASCTASCDAAGPCRPPFCTGGGNCQHFYPSPTGSLASEAEVGHHPHQQVPKRQNPILWWSRGKFGIQVGGICNGMLLKVTSVLSPWFAGRLPPHACSWYTVLVRDVSACTKMYANGYLPWKLVEE